MTRWGLLAAWLSSVALVLFSLYNLFQGGRLQGRLDRAHAVGVAMAAIEPPLAGNSADGLQRELERLLARDELGFDFMQVSDPSGLVLASAGLYEQLHIPLVAAFYSERVRRFLYALSAERTRVAVTREGRLLGHVEYGLSDTLSAAVREEAVDSLRWSGWLGLACGLPLMAVLTWLLRQGWAAQPTLMRRLQPGVATAGAAADAVAEPLAQAYRAQAGELLDQVERGLILVDRDARLRYMNHAAEQLTGWRAADAQGRLVYSVFHPLSEEEEPLITPAEVCLREQTAYAPRMCRLRARDGKLRPIEMLGGLLRDAEQRVEGAVMFFHDISSRQAATDDLKRVARLSRGVIDHLVEGVVTTDPAGIIRFANARALRMFGYAREELEGATVTKLMPVPFLNSPGIKLADYIAARQGPKLPKVVGWRKDATTFPVELVVEPMSVDAEEGYVVIVRDITERMKSENLALRLGRLLDNAFEEVYIFDAQSLYFLEVNSGARRNLGYRADQLARMTPLQLSPGLDSETFQAYLARLRGGEAEHLSYRAVHQRADGSTYPVEVRLNFSRDEEPPVFMAIAVDITERQAAESRLEHLASHDALTGLPNRTVLFDRLGQALLGAQRTRKVLAVMFLDLDRFKPINDQFGHETGDQVLLGVVERLHTTLRVSDTVARLSGDEFVILAAGLRHLNDAEVLAQKIVAAFQLPIVVGERSFEVSVSLGLTVYPLDDSSPEHLLNHADQAMYAAKKGGRAGYRVFAADVGPEVQQRMTLERDVLTALALDQLKLRMSLVVTAAGGRAAAVAVDFEWRHARHGVLSAVETLELAQKAGGADEIVLWMLRNLFRHFATGTAQGLAPLPMLVAMDAGQLRDDEFCRNLEQLLDEHRIPPRALLLGLPAAALLELRDAPSAPLERLRGRGVRLYASEAAAGFAELNRLAELRPHLLQIGAEQVALLPARVDTVNQLRAGLATAQSLSLPALAMGVATAAQRELLATLGCRYLCGPLWLAPSSPRDFGEFIRGRASEPL